jgi:hypothetical protein
MVIVADFQGYFRQVNPAWEKKLSVLPVKNYKVYTTLSCSPRRLEETRTAVENQEVGHSYHRL